MHQVINIRIYGFGYILCLDTIYLQYISLRFNKLTEVPTKFPPFLRNLDLVGNPITQILPNTFIYLPEVKWP